MTDVLTVAAVREVVEKLKRIEQPEFVIVQVPAAQLERARALIECQGCKVITQPERLT
jgi:hypothetical protein